VLKPGTEAARDMSKMDGLRVRKGEVRGPPMTGNTDYTIRQAAYDLRKLRGKELIIVTDRLSRLANLDTAEGV
jgi:hypothetical protein